MLGPLFRYDLVRLARGGIQPRWRAAFAGLLLAALLVGYLTAFPGVDPARTLFGRNASLPIPAAARFAENFVVAFLLVQVAVVVVLTPAVVAGGLADEVDKGTFALLRSAPLTNRELVLGAFAARLVYVGCVVLTGLPVLAVTMLFGGVDGGRLLAGYAITLATAFSLGSYAVHRAARGDGFGATLRQSYLTAAGLTVGGFLCYCLVLPAVLSPFSAVAVLMFGSPRVLGGTSQEDPLVVVSVYIVVHGWIGMLYLSLAFEAVRPAVVRGRPSAFTLADVPAAYRPRVVTPPPLPDRTVTPITPDEDGLLWKERNFGTGGLPTDGTLSYAVVVTVLVVAATFVFATAFLIVIHLVILAGGGPFVPMAETGFYARLAAAVVFLPLVVGLASAAAVSVARERQRGTLDLLLALPGDRRDILRAKASALLGRTWPAPVGVVTAVFLGVVSGGLWAAAAVVGPVLVVGWSAFAVALGLWLSVRCRTVVRAATLALAVLTAALVVPPACGPLLANLVWEPWTEESDDGGRFLAGLCPAVGVWRGLPLWEDVDPNDPRTHGVDVAAAITSGLLAAGAAGVLWWAAGRRFEVEGK